MFPICGVQELLDGDIGGGIFFLLPLIFVLCVLAYQQFYQKPKDKQQEALYKKYNLPNVKVVRGESGEVWNKEFQKVIEEAIESTSDTSNRTELQHCQSVAKELIKDSSKNSFDRPYYKLNNAFRLTGCHLTITDSKGNKITQIV